MPDRCQDDSSGKGRPEAGRRTRSTVGRSEDRYDPQHIESLLPELREAVIKKCDTARALHPFASYTDNLQKVVLHFEHFYCNTAVRFAARLDACIRSTVPRMAASGSCEATMLCPGIEFRRDVRPPVIQGIAMVSPVVTPIACSCPLLNETL